MVGVYRQGLDMADARCQWGVPLRVNGLVSDLSAARGLRVLSAIAGV